MAMHFAIAILNGVVFLKFVTRFSCDVFGFYVCAIYLQKGAQVRSPRHFTIRALMIIRSSWLSSRQGSRAGTFPSRYRF
jgi:hypothetical protein